MSPDEFLELSEIQLFFQGVVQTIPLLSFRNYWNLLHPMDNILNFCMCWSLTSR